MGDKRDSDLDEQVTGSANEDKVRGLAPDEDEFEDAEELDDDELEDEESGSTF